VNRRIHIVFIFLFMGLVISAQGPREQDSVQKLLKKLSRRDPARVDALVFLASFYPKDRIQHLDEAMAIAENINYLGGQVKTLSNYGSAAESGAKPDFSKSREYYYKALDIAKKMNDDSVMHVVYGQIFNSCIYLGDYPKALEVSLTQLKMAERRNHVKMMASQYNNIGFLYSNQNNYAKAKEYLVKYVELAEKVGEEGMLANAYNNMAEIHEKEKDYKAALEKLFKALDIYERIDKRKKEKEPRNNQMQQYLAVTYNNISNLYTASGDKKTALKYSLKCLEAASKVTINKYDLSVFYITNGNLYASLGDYIRAEKALNKGLEIANEIGHMEDRKLAHLGLSKMYAAKKDFKSALSNHRKYTQVKDSILNEKNTKQMAEMNTKYESEKKDKELVMKDVEINTRLLEAKQKAIIRNIFLAGFILVALLAVLIFRSYIIKRKANELMSQQKNIIEHKNKEITDSIQYANRIQKALLASHTILSKNVPEHFVLYKPKDIVSGDFYWAHEVNDKFLMCIADCTGHGVPGAFMSLLNISFLNESVNEKKMEGPDIILNSVRQSLISTLNTEGNENSKDGMDCVLCVIDKKKNKLTYAASNNVFYIIRQNALIVSSVDKMPVGRSPREHEPFKRYEFELMDGDMIYILTDGYADQFGGPKGKKFRYKQLEELLMQNHTKPMPEQNDLLNEAIEKWKGDVEQLDDILITGIKYKSREIAS
jgi:serine phosphatase RsbU (regulator of sigma subunit)